MKVSLLEEVRQLRRGYEQQKTIILIFSLLTAGIAPAYSQAFLAANNQITTPLTISLRAPDGFNTAVVGAPGALLGQGSVYVSLWVATNGAPLSSLVQVAIGTNSTSDLPEAIGTFNLGNPLYLRWPWDGSVKVELV